MPKYKNRRTVEGGGFNADVFKNIVVLKMYTEEIHNMYNVVVVGNFYFQCLQQVKSSQHKSNVFLIEDICEYTGACVSAALRLSHHGSALIRPDRCYYTEMRAVMYASVMWTCPLLLDGI